MWPHPRVRVSQHTSTVLEGNRSGDPHVRDLAVYLPAGYDDAPERRYAVLFALTGLAGTGLQFMNTSRLSPNLPERLDRLIESGSMKPMIVVMPDCYTRFAGSQYVNSTATGRYRDYIVDELVPWVDEHYRTLPQRESRGVVGKSSGGYGALVLGMRAAETFGAVASHAGDCYFELSYKCEVPGYVSGLRGFDGSIEKLVADFHRIDPRPKDAFSAMNIVAMSAAYSPNPDRAPLYLDVPFDPTTGELDGAVWARWLENDPVEMVAHHQEALKSLRLLYIDAGTRDEYHLQLGARILSQRLAALDVPHQHEEFDGGHSGINYRYDRSLPLLSAALAG